jgi:hypothetical protein
MPDANTAAMKRAVSLAFICLLPAVSQASVELTAHSYIHNPSGQSHTVFHLANYKKGLFFGSCGPSTRSLQWEYHIELTGKGPDYRMSEIELKDSSFQTVQLQGGSIHLVPAKRTATISLVLKQNSGAKEFVGNGTFKIKGED